MDWYIQLAKNMAMLPMLLTGFGLASFFYKFSLDPEDITIDLPPVLLIHGSDSNQQQWILFRQLLAKHRVGHIFTVNLNKKSLQNDPGTDILDYAHTVHDKIVA